MRTVLALLILVAPLSADEYVLIVHRQKATLVVISDDGTAKLANPQIVRVGNGPTPKPDDPDDPTIPVPTNPSDQVKAWAEQINDPDRSRTSKLIAATFRTVLQLPIQTKEQLVAGTNSLYQSAMSNPAVNKLALWSSWKDKVDGLAAGAATLDEAKTLWQQIATGLEAVQ